MATQNPSKETSHNRPINKFLFDVVNNFTLPEFKKYTNFPDVVKAAVLKMEKQPDVPDPYSLHDRIRHNFKKLPDENWWKKGLFKDLKLKAKFYRSDVAKRIFKKMYDLKSCAVRIDLPTEQELLPTESGHSVNVEEPLETPSDGDNVVAVPSQVDLRPSDESSIGSKRSAPKETAIYPRKQMRTDISMTTPGIPSYPLETSFDDDNVVAAEIKISPSDESSIDTSIAPKRPVKYPRKLMRRDISVTSTRPEGFNEENFIAPSEPAPASSKRVVQRQPPESAMANQKVPSKENLVSGDAQKRQLCKLYVGPQGQLYVDVMNDLPVQFVYITQSDALTQRSESLKLREKFKQSVERASEHLIKYITETDPNVQSIKNFWYDFLKTEYEDDISAAETQLSQAILHPNQLNAVEEQMEVDQVDEVQNVQEVQNGEVAQNVNGEQNVDEIQMELESPLVDHAIKIKVENDLNLTNSSDVQIIDLPPDEPIEILEDETEQLLDILQVHGNDSEDLYSPLVISAPTAVAAAGSTRRFLTSLPVIPSKKRNYQPLDIVVGPVHRDRVTEFDASSLQRVTPPSIENNQIEECAMTESQHQRQNSRS